MSTREVDPRTVRDGPPRRKPVLTVSPEELVILSQKLLRTAVESGYRPDAVLSIATGGVHVMEAMDLTPTTQTAVCSLSRPSSAVKKSTGASRVLRRLPRPVADWLRRIEDWFLERKTPEPAKATPILREQLEAFASRPQAMPEGVCRVLVVDDAIDSGATIKCVVEELNHRLSDDYEVRTAVLTTTRSEGKRLITPDYTLFEQTLLRFPWSNDYR